LKINEAFSRTIDVGYRIRENAIAEIFGKVNQEVFDICTFALLNLTSKIPTLLS